MTQPAGDFARSELKALLGQNQLLRVKSLISRIDVSLTLASVGRTDMDLGYIETGERCLRLARQGYHGALAALAGVSTAGAEREAILARLEDLRRALAGLNEPMPDSAPLPAATASSAPPVNGTAARLTHREQDVVKLVAEGLSTKQIAAKLGITFKTAACHRCNAMSKLGVQNAASLVSSVIRLGLI